MRRRAEKIVLAAMALVGIAVLLVDTLGWLDRLGDAVPKITLLVLSTVTVFLLIEVERFQTLDNIEDRLAELDINTIAKKLKRDHYAGVVQVHHSFAEKVFIHHIESAKEITILNTWIPNLRRFEQSLADAISRHARVKILLLYPNSMVARLRDESLWASRERREEENVKEGVEGNLNMLESIQKRAGKRGDGYLEVKVYNSLPSISVYRAGEHYLVSVFLHNQLAIHSPQLEIDGAKTTLGEQVQEELDTLWDKGHKINLATWRRDLDIIRP